MTIYQSKNLENRFEEYKNGDLCNVIQKRNSSRYKQAQLMCKRGYNVVVKNIGSRTKLFGSYTYQPFDIGQLSLYVP